MARSFSISHCDSAKPPTVAPPSISTRNMNGLRLLLRPLEDGNARSATSLAKEARICRNEANTVAHAAMIAARTPSDIATLQLAATLSRGPGGTDVATGR